ncbi:hypothetical protein [Actinoplanes subtropicus]|uniref:hypothetical protein n=1 Tax=Actinoplanes subtropicus TaxID=543632 RepID=UPI0012FCFF62|nr:hypothetical protein [Actinoplanes subtropicus]
MMENRSFDHLVGFLDHDNPEYPRLDRLDVSCPRYPWLPFGPKVRPTPDALAVLGTDPDHSHEAVMDQLYPRLGRPTMTGFIDSYAYKIKHGTMRRMPWWQKAFSRLLEMLSRLFRRRQPIPATADEIMRCFPPADLLDQLPLLETPRTDVRPVPVPVPVPAAQVAVAAVGPVEPAG